MVSRLPVAAGQFAHHVVACVLAGIEPLLQAEAINPKDGIVLGNIAQGYKLKEDTANAINYYGKMLNLDDPEAKAFAQKQMQALRTR